jgi:protein TonB
MKAILVVVIPLITFLKTNAQGNVKASDVIRVDGSFVSCDYEILASFPGGINRFNQYLAKNIHYPENAIKSGVHGKVILDFIIEKNGKIGAIKIFKSISRDLDAEAIRVLKDSPKWNPTKDCGKAVRTQYRLPIDFQLPKTKS